MKNFLKLFLFISIAVIASSAGATTWKTVNYGYWNDASIWDSGISPGFNLSDTFEIMHPVVLTDDLHLQNGSYMTIDSTGGICGHENMFVYTGATVFVYGILELDIVSMPGGYVFGINPATLIFTQWGIVSNGGGIYITGAALSVGPWFDCMLPQYGFLTGMEENQEAVFSVYPNPASDVVYFKSNEKFSKVVAIDTKGTFRSLPFFTEGSTIMTNQLNNGLYLFEFYSNDKCFARKKMMIER